MIFNMGAKTTLWGKDCPLTNAAGKIGYPSSMWISQQHVDSHMQNNKIGPILYSMCKN